MHCTNNFAFNLLLQEREDIYDKADSVFKSWIDKNIKYNDFRYEDVELIHIDGMVMWNSKNSSTNSTH